MLETPLEYATIIYNEMLSHPALFSHRHPQYIALIGEKAAGIQHEVAKHSTVKEIKTSIQQPDFFDIVIHIEPSTTDSATHHFSALNNDGILIQLCDSPFEIATLKETQQKLFAAGFQDIQMLNFPQSDLPLGLRCALIAKKTGVLKKIREKDIFNKSFSTLYYNFDIHRAALVVPQFMREELMES